MSFFKWLPFFMPLFLPNFAAPEGALHGDDSGQHLQRGHIVPRLRVLPACKDALKRQRRFVKCVCRPGPDPG